MKIEEEEYFTQRLEDQIKYYDRQSSKNQLWHRRTKKIEFFSAICIPFLAANLSDIDPWGTWVVGILGIAIAVSEATSSLYKFQENWLLYRSMAEALTREKFLYLTHNKPYHRKNAFSTLVVRVEAMLAEENSQWVEAMQQENAAQPDKEQQGGQEEKSPKQANK